MKIKYEIDGVPYVQDIPLEMRQDGTTGTPYEIAIWISDGIRVGKFSKGKTVRLKIDHYDVVDDVVLYRVVGVVC